MLAYLDDFSAARLACVRQLEWLKKIGDAISHRLSITPLLNIGRLQRLQSSPAEALAHFGAIERCLNAASGSRHPFYGVDYSPEKQTDWGEWVRTTLKIEICRTLASAARYGEIAALIGTWRASLNSMNSIGILVSESELVALGALGRFADANAALRRIEATDRYSCVVIVAYEIAIEWAQGYRSPLLAPLLAVVDEMVADEVDTRTLRLFHFLAMLAGLNADVKLERHILELGSRAANAINDQPFQYRFMSLLSSLYRLNSMKWESCRRDYLYSQYRADPRSEDTLGELRDTAHLLLRAVIVATEVGNYA